MAALSYRLEAYLDGVWVDLSEDVYAESGSVIRQGIPGGRDIDLIARPGTLTVNLYNADGKYTTGGTNALIGWGLDVKLRLRVTYQEEESTQFVGWVREIEPIINSAEKHQVRVTAYDWLEQAARVPIMPQIQRDTSAGQAVQSILDMCPVKPDSASLAQGSTFLTIFDSITGYTTAYGELAKIAHSEFGHLYMRRNGTLVLESGTQRNANVQPSSVSFHFLSLDNGELLLLEETGKLLLHSSSNMLSYGYGALDIDYGAYYANYGKVTAYPRRVDRTPVVLAKTNNPIFVSAGKSTRVKLPYVDPLGVAQHVTALTDKMAPPTEGHTIDPTLMTCVSFNIDASDAVGRHIWSLGDCDIVQSVYADGYGIVRISGSPPTGGGYLICGGYPNYRTTTPPSNDFNFGNQPFTIGWWEARINISQQAASITSDNAASFPAWLLGYLDAPTREMKIYMSSNGATWDIANGRSLGILNASRWRYYEVSRDEEGWFYAFADGKLTDKWHSSLPLNSAGTVTIGQSPLGWVWTGISDFFVHKGICLHTSDFEPPKLKKSIYLDEDYWGNTKQDRSGNDITNDISIATAYGTREVTVDITNNSSYDGYVYFQQRGIGVYFDAPIEASVEDSALIATDGYVKLEIAQKYQYDTSQGIEKMTTILDKRKSKRADLKQVTILGDASEEIMRWALYSDVGDMIHIRYDGGSNIQIDGYYYIQFRNLKLQHNVECSWILQQDFNHE